MPAGGAAMVFQRFGPALLLAAAGAPAIVFGLTLSERSDQDVFHVPLIRRFAEELPFPDISSYNAAMTPLYHLVMAVVARAGVTSVQGLSFVTLFVSALGVCAIQWFFSRFTTPRRAAIFAAVIGLSPYYLGSAVFVVTDNPAFALMVAALAVALARPARPDWRASLAVTAAVMTRQVYVWLLPFTVLASARGASWRRSVIVAAAWMAIPAMFLAAILWLWGGPLPRGFSAYPHPPSLLPIIAILASLGLWSLPLLPALYIGSRRRQAAIFFVLIAGLGSLLLASASINAALPSPWGGGMRTLGKYAGTLGGTSIIYWVGLWLGSVTVALLVMRNHAGHERLLLLAGGLWMAAQCLNANMSERYYHPFVLLVLFSFASGLRGRAARAGTALLIGAVLLATFVRFAVHGAGLLRL